jgi:hypothetical protein
MTYCQCERPYRCAEEEEKVPTRRRRRNRRRRSRRRRRGRRFNFGRVLVLNNLPASE